MKKTYYTRIERRLQAAFNPIHMEIKDDSANHAGHAGYDSRGETHFKVVLVSESFTNLARIARHRLVYDALADEMKERIHALSLTLLTPPEYRNE